MLPGSQQRFLHQILRTLSVSPIQAERVRVQRSAMLGVQRA
jgi:hypothetical protein